MAGEAIAELTSKLGLDTTDFKAGISAANRELRVIESGFRASAAAIGDWGDSSEGLESRISTLTQAMGVQQLKVAALREEYSRIAAESGDNSKAAKDFEIRVNKEVEALNKMGKELNDSQGALEGLRSDADAAGKSLDTMGNEAEEGGKKLDGLKKVASGLGSGLKVASKAVAGLAVAAAGVGVAVTKMVTDTAEASGELVDLSAKTGISTERLQELAYVGDQVGTSSDTMISSLSKLVRSIGDAKEGTGTASDSFASLGVSITDAEGNLRSSEAVFNDVIDALGKIPNETERDTIAMDLFGKSAMELNPLIKAGADEIENLSKQAHEVGAVMDEETVASFESFGDTLAGLQAGLKGTVGTLAATFLPAFAELGDKAQGYMKELTTVIKDSGGDASKAAEGIGKVLGEVVNDLAAQAPQMLEAGLGLIKGILSAIVTNLPVLATAAVEIMTTLVKFIVDNLPDLIDAGLKMIVTLATAITAALPELIPAIVEVIPKIILVLLENLPLLIDAALQLILALAEGLIAAIPILIPYIPEIVTAIVDALVLAFPMILDAATELIGVLVTGIIAALPTVAETAVELIKALFEAMQKLDQMIRDVGKGIIDGVWAGIQANVGEFTSKVTGFFTGIIDAVKNTLGIHSPSTVFAGIGKNMAMGLGVGFDKAFSGVENSIAGAVNGLSTPQVTFAGAGAGMTGASGGLNITINGTIASDLDMRKVALYVAEEIRRRQA